MSCVTESIKTQQLEQKIAQITKERDAERKEKDVILSNYRILEKDYTKLEGYCDTIEKKLDNAVSNYTQLEKELIDTKEELADAQTRLD